MNAIVGQSGGPTAVINASLAGVYEAAVRRGAGRVYGMRHGVQGLLQRQYVDLSDHIRSDLDVELLKRTPSSFLGSCRYKLPEIQDKPEVYRTLFSILEELEIGWFFYIGGNDSMDTISKLSDYGRQVNSPIRFVGVPKTIDNDLEGTDHTPGFGSAAKYIATLMKEIIRDSLVYDMRSVTVVEIMGRNAGWLTSAASLAAGDDCEGVDRIYLPEVAFDPEAFVQDIRALQETKGNVVVAVSEGIRTADGRYVCELQEELGPRDAFGHKILTGTARYLAGLLTERLGTKARAIELSTLQRCSSHTASRTDITEAYQVGGAAVKAASEGHTGEMVGLSRLSDDPYQCATVTHDIHEIANREKRIPVEWITPDHANVTEELRRYLRPLIQAELTPIYVNGLPRHIYLK